MPKDLTGTTLGRYQIMERLGRGGMADVYRAYQPSMDRYVAVKVMHGHLSEDESFVTRFKREAQSVGTLRHPNIVQVIDFDIEGDEYYMVMEYVQGETLKALLKQNGALSVPEAVEIAIKLADAVAYAHKQGLIHRDIKPANVLMPSRTDPVLSDFGIARITDATGLTNSGVSIGTPAYMSPEAGRGERVDERADIYSLGIVLYEMLTGTVPYDADTPYAVILKHINDPLPMLRQFVATLPESVERIALKALAKNPAERYQTADEMKVALENAQATLLSAAPTSEARRTAKMDSPVQAAPAPTGRGNLPIVAAIGAVVLVIVIGGVVLSGVGRAPDKPTGLGTAPVSSSPVPVIGSAPTGTSLATSAAGVATSQPTASVSAATATIPAIIAATADSTATATIAPASINSTAASTAAEIASAALGAKAVDPKYADLIQRGTHALIVNSAGDILPEVDKAIGSDPQSYDLLVMHGRLLVSTTNADNVQKALSEEQAALAMAPTRPEAYLALAEYYYTVNPETSEQQAANLRQGLDYLKQYMQVDSQDFYVYWLRAHLNQSLNGIVGADSNVSQQQIDADFEKAAGFNPPYIRFYVDRGDHYFTLKQYDMAQQSLEKALTIDPNDPDTHALLGSTYIKQNTSEKAFALYSNNVEHENNHDPKYLADAAFIARISHHADKASEWAKTALGLDPKMTAATYVLALLAMDNHDYKNALALLDTVAEVDKYSFSYPYLNPVFGYEVNADRARALIALNQPADALDAYAHSIENFNDWIGVYIERAKLYIKQNDSDHAREDLKHALQLALDNHDSDAQKVILDLLDTVGPGDDTPTPTS